MTEQTRNSDSTVRTEFASGQGDSASGAWTKTTDLASSAQKNIGAVANEGLSSLRSKVNEALDQRVASSAHVVKQVAQSVSRVAADLESTSPQAASLVSSLAHTIEGYSEGLGGQSAEQLVRSATNFTKQQPALVFGLAAFAGFFAYRTFSAAASSKQPYDQGQVRHSRHGL